MNQRGHLPTVKTFGWRMVWQREVEKLSLKNIALNLSVDASTVYRIVNTFQTTGTVMKKLYSSLSR